MSNNKPFPDSLLTFRGILGRKTEAPMKAMNNGQLSKNRQALLNNVHCSLFIVLYLLTLPFAQDLQSDTTAIRAILQANGISDTVQIKFQTPPPPFFTSVNGRVTGVTLNSLGIQTLTNDLAALDSLHNLQLDSNQLTTLPAEIGNLTSLSSRLSISYNLLTTLPAEIGNLTNLGRFELNGNQLTTLPAEIGNLTSLTIFEVSNNQLASLPPEIGNLTQTINRFYFSNNQLTSLPSTFGNIGSSGSGGEMILNDNQLTSLPASVGSLGVATLNLNNNAITVLPDEICNNSSLSRLQMNNNNLTALPDCIGNMSNMINLQFNDNQISNFPVSILNSSTLQIIFLQNNELQNLPSGIVDLSIDGFYIGGNRLCPGNYSAAVENWLDFNDDSDPYWKTTQRCTDPVHYVQGAGELFTLAQFGGRLEVRFAEGVRAQRVDVLNVKGRTPTPPHLYTSTIHTWNTSAWDRGVYVIRATTNKGILIRKTVINE